MIKITKADDVIIQNNIIVTLYGVPGIGKTSLGFSADKPLMLDFDNGAQRSVGRKDAVVIKQWSDIKDLSAKDLTDYNTLVIDTAGRLLEVMSLDLIRENSKLAKSTGELSLAGYGALNNAFKAFLLKIKSFGKDIVLIAHSKESKDGDQTINRVDSVGSSKEEILRCSDLLGYMQTKNNMRTINFNPTDANQGKNCAQFPCLNIPTYEENKSFLADIIAQTKEHMNKKTEEQIKKEQAFNAALEMINQADTLEDINSLMLTLKENNSSNILKSHLLDRAKDLGIEFDKEQKCFVMSTPHVDA
jgi:ATP-dependent Lon protease